MGCLRIKYDDGIPAPKNWKDFVGGIEKSEAYRYDYQGQFAEKDGETGLHSFEATAMGRTHRPVEQHRPLRTTL